MSNNANMRDAREKRNDEHYTKCSDVADEILRFAPFLKGKRILCPFSDYRFSQVVHFLVQFFHILGLEHLTATCIDLGASAWRFDYDGKTQTVIRLKQGGSFDSPEVTEIMYHSDVVIDNPPFSKFEIIFLWLENAPARLNSRTIQSFNNYGKLN